MYNMSVLKVILIIHIVLQLRQQIYQTPLYGIENKTNEHTSLLALL